MASLWAWAAVTGTAAVASFVNALAGGGTFLTFPALVGIGGLSERAANMTSTIGLWPGSAASVVAARGQIRKVPRGMLVAFGLISLIGGTIGSLLLIYTSNETFRLVIPWLLLFATVIFGFSKPIARWAGRKHGHRSVGWTIIVGLVQLLVAIYGGYFGAGIGVLMLAGLSFAGLDDIHQVNALKVLLGTLINGVAVVIFIFGGIDWGFALSMAVASAISGFAGMHFAQRVRPEHLRWIILGVGLVLTGVYFYQVYWPNGRS